MNGINYFCFGDFCSAENDIIITSPPQEVIAERDVEVISVMGRSGDLIRDNERYKNITISYECAVIPSDDRSMRESLTSAIASINISAGYRRLATTYDNDHFRMARISSEITVDSIVEQAGNFKIAFDCKPQRFLCCGCNETTICKEDLDAKTGGYALYNLYFHTALPVITVYGSGQGTLVVGDIVVDILSLEDCLTLDCEMMNAYRQVGDGAMDNRNSTIRAAQFPVLKAGENRISFSGGIEKVNIIPRWWIL